MMKTRPRSSKVFDCVAMKRRGSQLLYKKLQGLSRQEKLEFWQQKDVDLLREQRKMRQMNPKKAVPVK